MMDYSTLERVSKWKSLPPPPGFSTAVTSAKGKESVSKSKTISPKAKAEHYEELKAKRAWSHAISPAKQLPMQAVMVYFSGGGVQIFSMGMVAMLLAAPFKAFVGMNEAFAQFAPDDSSNPTGFSTLIIQKIVYILCNILTLAVGAFKCHQMGLLPVGTGDWLAFEHRGESPELSFY